MRFVGEIVEAVANRLSHMKLASKPIVTPLENSGPQQRSATISPNTVKTPAAEKNGHVLQLFETNRRGNWRKKSQSSRIMKHSKYQGLNFCGIDFSRYSGRNATSAADFVLERC